MGIIILLSILLVMLIALTVIGWIFWDWDGEFASVLTVTLSIIIGVALFMCSVGSISNQVFKDAYIYELEQNREALVDSYNTYYNNYDKDLAHSQSLKEIRQEIADFNAEINENNYFCNSFWLNWFYVNCESIEPITINNGYAQ